jgi:tyrosinase
VLASAARGALGGAGAALLGRGISPALLGSEPTPSARAQGVTVSIFDSAFEPATIEVAAGTEITWTNSGQEVNTATSFDCGITFNSGQLDPGATFSHTFATAGAFPYQNAANPLVMGMVTVTAAPKTYVRRNLHSLAPDALELQAYALAVKKMKKRELKNPTSWLYQSYIHGVPQQALLDLVAELGGNPTDLEIVAALGDRGWMTCEHHTAALSRPYFWPWHRMYLYWFERIVRDVGGYPDFALPYWDYLDPEQRVLPEPFRDPDSPLYVGLRDPALNGGGVPDVSAELAHAIFGNLCAGFGQNDFLNASNALETTPHDYIHRWAGGEFANPPVAGLMGAVPTSAQDPLFWLHHANLDRLWASWRALGGSDPTDPAWLNNDRNNGVFETADPPLPPLPYSFFDETGTKVTKVRVVHEVLDTFALGYTYDDFFTPIVRLCRPCAVAPPGPPAATPAAPGPSVELGRSEPDERIAIGPDPVAIPVRIQQPEAAVASVTRGEQVVVTLEGVRGEGVLGTFYEVYINLPEGQTPDFRSPYFVGNISLFGLQPWDTMPIHTRHTGTQQFDISRNVAALQERGEWTGEAIVTVVPYYSGAMTPIEPAGATPTAGVATPAAAPPAGPWITFDGVIIDGE